MSSSTGRRADSRGTESSAPGGIFDARRVRTLLLPCLLLAILALAAFLPATRNGFINLDDNNYVTQNPQVRSGLSWGGLAWAFRATAAANWHPVTWLSHMADCELFGLEPWGHHLTSILFHTVNTLLLFLLFRKMTRATWRSLVLAALFGLHPLRVESVAWVAERKDVLSMFFFLLTLWAYVRYAEARRQNSEGRTPKAELRSQGPEGSRHPVSSIQHPASSYIVCLVFFALGLLSKPMLVTLPFVLLLLDYWPLRRLQPSTLNPQPSTFLPLLLEKLPFFALSAASCVVTFIVQQRAGAVAETLPLAARAENALVAYCRYLGKLFWPLNLCAAYPHPDYWPMLAVLVSAAVLVAVSALAAVQWRRRPYLLVGWLWYLGTLVPVIGLVQVGQQSIADRYTYLPTIGMLMVVIWSVCELSTPWRYRTIVLSALSAALMLAAASLTARQIPYWKNSETLFRHALAVAPRNPLAEGCLAQALAAEGLSEEAVAHYRAVLKLRPNDSVAANNLGHLLAEKGEVDEAIRQFQEALKHKPNDWFAHNNLGMALARRGQLDEAITHFRIATTLKPNDPDAFSNLGVALSMKGRLDEAILAFQQAVKVKPGHAKAHKRLGVALAKKGLFNDAVKQFQEAVALQPDDTEAQRYLQAAKAQAARPPNRP